MPEFVIQVLEVVNVNHDHSHSGLKSAGPLDFLDNPKLKVTAVENTGKAIQIGKLLHSFNIVGVLNGGGANIGH